MSAEHTLNEALAAHGFTTREAGHYRKDIIRGERVVLRNANSAEAWEWLKCAGCVSRAKEGFGPDHDGSPRCRSGSIASGGARAHCTCDTCF